MKIYNFILSDKCVIDRHVLQITDIVAFIIVVLYVIARYRGIEILGTKTFWHFHYRWVDLIFTALLTLNGAYIKVFVTLS